FWKHTFYRFFQYFQGVFLLKFECSHRLLTTRVTCMPDVSLVSPLVSGKGNLSSIQNDHVISAVCVRRKIRLVLSSQNLCNLRSQSAKRLSFSVYHNPFFISGSFIS